MTQPCVDTTQQWPAYLLLLQESVSLSHAVSIVLAQLYQARLSAVAAAAGVTTMDLPYSVRSVNDLAGGYDCSSGTEH